MKQRRELQIVEVENGFIVSERVNDFGERGEQWVFETAEALAKFVQKWGKGDKDDSQVTDLTDSQGYFDSQGYVLGGMKVTTT